MEAAIGNKSGWIERAVNLPAYTPKRATPRHPCHAAPLSPAQSRAHALLMRSQVCVPRSCFRSLLCLRNGTLPCSLDSDGTSMCCTCNSFFSLTHSCHNFWFSSLSLFLTLPQFPYVLRLCRVLRSNILHLWLRFSPDNATNKSPTCSEPVPSRVTMAFLSST